MKTFKIEFPSLANPRFEEARNEHRVLCELDVISAPYLAIRYLIPEGVTTDVELYESEVGALLADVRTPEHDGIQAAAEAMASNLRESWIESEEKSGAFRRMTEEQRAEHIEWNFHVRAPSCVPLIDRRYRTGLPPLRSVTVLGAEGARIDAASFVALDPSARRSFLRSPPRTDANSAALANDHLLGVLKRALGQ